MLQCVAVDCRVFECVAVWRSVYMSVRMSSRSCGVSSVSAVKPRCVAVCCSVLQCVAGCCSVLQGVAVCRSLLQCVNECAHVVEEL